MLGWDGIFGESVCLSGPTKKSKSVEIKGCGVGFCDLGGRRSD